MRRPRRRRRTEPRCPGDEVSYLTPDAYRVGMLITLSKSPSGDPLTDAQRAEVELFIARSMRPSERRARRGRGASSPASGRWPPRRSGGTRPGRRRTRAGTEPERSRSVPGWGRAVQGLRPAGPVLACPRSRSKGSLVRPAPTRPRSSPATQQTSPGCRGRGDSRRRSGRQAFGAADWPPSSTSPLARSRFDAVTLISQPWQTHRPPPSPSRLCVRLRLLHAGAGGSRPAGGLECRVLDPQPCAQHQQVQH